MESVVSENCPPLEAKNSDVRSTDSAENFQKFMYELFEKNGVINDLRAYLRGHIVNVLRSAQTGDPPVCQRHFTQRLELTFQALNMLIAEYLLRLEFNYSLSVFVSEIPLANMVFAFAKSLMQSTDCAPDLRFKENDVWSILNYLGVKCDSNHASNIAQMYKEEKNAPLLLCILKCTPMYRKYPVNIDPGNVNSPQDSLSSSPNSSSTLEEKIGRNHSYHEKCKHHVYCKTCQSRLLRIKDKYSKKKKNLAKNLKKESNVNPLHSLNVESLMRNIDVMERSLIDEMFQQLKSVYEAEMEMMKHGEEKRVKRSLASHAVQLQKKHDEMEQAFKVREAELERSVQQKKRFLWGLARALREQHQHMSRAMRDVREETSRLSAKEDSLKSQLAEAEQILRQRGEEMRNQISNELTTLERHLESMKQERDSINKERSELEHIKDLCDTTKTNNIENENLKSHYDLLKNELVILKKYLETSNMEPKCVMERSTITELSDVSSKIDVVLNNGQDVGRSSEDKVKSKQFVNDLKKQKNVNFNQANLDEIFRERSRSRSRSSASSEGGDAQLSSDGDSLQRLRDENERLRTFARQQREHIDELSSQQARLQAELVGLRHRPPAAPPRPRTAPAAVPEQDFTTFLHRMTSSASVSNFSHGWRKGAGEELSFFANAQPRIVVPGDTLPFIGVVRERHTDNRRYLINQWRSLRHRTSPLGGVTKQRTSSPIQRDRTPRERPGNAGPSTRISTEQESVNPGRNEEDGCHNICDQCKQRPEPADRISEIKTREKSPKSMLREAKNKLRNKDLTTPPAKPREKSPNSVLREAKLRLRKLEIEAEAVEQSYLDFRRRQDERRDDSTHLDAKRIISSHKMDEVSKDSTSHRPEDTMKTDLDKYLKEYHAKYGLGETHFKNRNAASFQTKPIPAAYCTNKPTKEFTNANYLETPLNEFRKYYQSEKRYRYEENRAKSPIPTNLVNSDCSNITNDVRQEQAKSVVPKTLEKSERPKSPILKELEKSERPKSPVSKTRKLDRSKSPVTKLDDRSELPKSPVSKTRKSDRSKSPITKIDDTLERPKSPVSKIFDKSESSSNGEDARRKSINNRQASNDKAKELEILKHNINKIYNLPEQSTLNTSLNDSADDDRKNENENGDIFYILQESKIEISGTEPSDVDNKAEMADKNLLRIEVESVSKVEDVKITDSQAQELLLVVESSVDNNGDSAPSDAEFEYEKISTKMTILVSPKRSNLKGEIPKTPDMRGSQSLESGKLENIGVKDIYQTNANELSSIQMQLEQSKEELDNTISELEQNEGPDYPDDFSADVDNYNSRSEYDNNSPISQPKTSEDENFWDS